MEQRPGSRPEETICFVEQLGLRLLAASTIEGLQDRYRNPTTQAGFAKQWGGRR